MLTACHLPFPQAADPPTTQHSSTTVDPMVAWDSKGNERPGKAHSCRLSLRTWNERNPAAVYHSFVFNSQQALGVMCLLIPFKRACGPFPGNKWFLGSSYFSFIFCCLLLP